MAATMTTPVHTTTRSESLPLKPLPNVQRNKYNPPANQPATIRSKKEALPPSLPMMPPTILTVDASQPPISQSQVKKITRKSSKPIINWFQRKLAGTRARRASEGDALRSQRVLGSRTSNVKEKRRSSVPSVPPLPAAPERQRSKGNARAQPHREQNPAGSIVTSTRQNAISLDSDYDQSVSDANSLDTDDRRRTSSVLESTWSPNSVYEADEDASVRPIPPSVPPSPSPSHSSSSYLSHPRTFASMAASTKPTTLLSIDLTGGMAHIAQAPPTPTLPSHRMSPHIRTHSAGFSSGGSITFSVLPPASPSRPSSSTHGHMPLATSRSLGQPSLQAPQHTTHHPRNNPRPSSPPPDDASVLTLASSAFGLPGARIGAATLGRSGRTSVADDSISHFSHPLGDSTSQFLLGDGEIDDERVEEERYTYGDVDASVRALRPRSSRRGSWESEASGWSARLTGTHVGAPNGLKDRSLWTSGSHKTGPRSVQTEDEDEDLDTDTGDKLKIVVAHGNMVSSKDDSAPPLPPLESSDKSDIDIALHTDAAVETDKKKVTQQTVRSAARPGESTSLDKMVQTPSSTPKGTTIPLDSAVEPDHLTATSSSHAGVVTEE